MGVRDAIDLEEPQGYAAKVYVVCARYKVNGRKETRIIGLRLSRLSADRLKEQHSGAWVRKMFATK